MSGRQLLEDGRDDLAWSAPVGVEVYDRVRGGGGHCAEVLRRRYTCNFGSHVGQCCQMRRDGGAQDETIDLTCEVHARDLDDLCGTLTRWSQPDFGPSPSYEMLPNGSASHLLCK